MVQTMFNPDVLYFWEAVLGTGMRGKAGGHGNRCAHPKDRASGNGDGGGGGGYDGRVDPASNRNRGLNGLGGESPAFSPGHVDSHGALASLGILPCTETAAGD